MKDKIVYLIIGILVGAIITAGCFVAFLPKGVRTKGDMSRGGMENRIKGDRPDDRIEPPQESEL